MNTPTQMLNAEETFYEVNTGITGTSSITIPIFKGKLDCIIVDVEKKIDFIIESSLGYLILKRNYIEGINYFAIRTRIIPAEDDLRDILTFDKFNLNEKLIITCIGQKNTSVKFILRAY